MPSPVEPCWGRAAMSITCFGIRASCYFDGRFLAVPRVRTSVGDMSIGPGRGCVLAMCAERRFVWTCSPQNLHRALPGEMWTRCILHKHERPPGRTSSADGPLRAGASSASFMTPTQTSGDPRRAEAKRNQDKRGWLRGCRGIDSRRKDSRALAIHERQ
jgi:hypothetical protein